MRVVQIIDSTALPHQRRLRTVDAVALAEVADVVEVPAAGLRLELPDASQANGAIVAHLYAPPGFAPALLKRLPRPLVSESAPRRPRLPWSRIAPPEVVLGPAPDSAAPEAVSNSWFELRGRRTDRPAIGVFARSDSVREAVAASRSRIERFRGDVRWTILQRFPEPEDLENLAVWLDPSPVDDHEGGVNEALAAGRIVVASRTPANVARTASGEAGFLVPPGDPNETVHALLAALFKPEAVRPRMMAAEHLSERLRPAARAAKLMEIYRGLQ